MRFVVTAAWLLGLVTAAGASEPWLVARPGMAVADHEAAWRDHCREFILSDDAGEENYLTCHPDPDTVVTANIAPDGVVWWSRFWGAGHLERPAFVAHFAAELGLPGAPSDCTSYRDAAECWEVGSTLVMIPVPPQGGRWTITMEDIAGGR